VTDAQVLEIVVGAMQIAAKLSAPILVVTLAIGVVVSLLQTVTQIQEQSLTFVPKLLAVGLLVVLLGNWMIREMTNWVSTLWRSIPGLL